MASKPVSGLLDRVSCPICMEKYNADVHVPKILPCEHTFCLACLASISTSMDRVDEVECPVCRAKHSVPPHGFITSRAALDIIDQLEKDTAPSPSKLTFSKHWSAECVLVCIDCLSGLCPKCMKQSTHHGHHVEEFSDAKVVLKPMLTAQIKKEQAALDTRMNDVPFSVAKLNEAESDINKRCDEAVELITTWKKDQLSKIGSFKQLAVVREKEGQAEKGCLQSMLEQYDTDIGTMIAKLKSDQAHKKHILETEYIQIENCDFQEQSKSLADRLQSVFTSQEFAISSKKKKQALNVKPNVAGPNISSKVSPASSKQASDTLSSGIKPRHTGKGDTNTIANLLTWAQTILNEVNEAGKTLNMKMNAKKTKAMIIPKKDDKPRISTIIDGTNIEQVANFPYLGQKITEDGRCKEEIKRRINIARTTFSKMSKVLTSKKIALNTRKRILQCYIWSTLQYGVETWTITGSMAKRLSAFEMCCYRRMLRISWTEKVSNEEVLERAKSRKDYTISYKQKNFNILGTSSARMETHCTTQFWMEK